MVVGLVCGPGLWDGVNEVGARSVVVVAARCEASRVLGELVLAGRHSEVQGRRLRRADLDLQSSSRAVMQHDPGASGLAIGCISVVLVMSW